MITLLKKISEKAIELGDFEFTPGQIENKWLGIKPALKTDIELTEKKLKVKLPIDYKQFLLITNGFSLPNNVEPTFEPIEKIDFLKNIDDFLVKVWNQEGVSDIGQQLEQGILVGGSMEEQYFLLIPPKTDLENWKYWKFSSWQPGEVEFKNLEHYFTDVLEFMNDCIEENK
ncbi:SMI1/KNR4 family protein [Mangrovimonas sp. ST2L15]|uniref:SMI1/KNR4 family protein n=1 Tax=Mangrovimonas sp. ST2L15 TaxID=1645916 RepID=UPI0006B65728|nr:SMI1/KNR4 family protein [Mangrovimonas sp. ST2L15]